MTALPQTMTAIEISQPGGPEVLKPTKRPVPSPAENEVLIKVAAAGVNRPDVLQRQGSYAPPPGATDIPGLEIAGEIVSLGDGVTTNNVENFFSIFKCGMRGIYQHCSEKHLQRYLTEFDFRFNNRGVDNFERAMISKQHAEGKRLTYRWAKGEQTYR